MVRLRILKIHIQTVTAKGTMNELEDRFEIIAANAAMTDIENTLAVDEGPSCFAWDFLGVSN